MDNLLTQEQTNALINEAAGSAAAEALEAFMLAHVYAPQEGVAKLNSAEKTALAMLLNKATRLAEQ